MGEVKKTRYVFARSLGQLFTPGDFPLRDVLPFIRHSVNCFEILSACFARYNANYKAVFHQFLDRSA